MLSFKLIYVRKFMIVREIVTELIQAKRVDLITDRTQDKPFEEKSQIVVGRS